MDNLQNPNFSERERRRYPRIDLIFKIECELLKNITDNKAEILKGEGKDISLGGISFKVAPNSSFSVGDMVLVKLSIPELEGNLNAMGRIIRIWKEKENTICAMKFTTIDPVDFEILSRIIEENQK